MLFLVVMQITVCTQKEKFIAIPLYLFFYVDDTLKTRLGTVKDQLFFMKDLGSADHILGMRIDRDRNEQIWFLVLVDSIWLK
jgi:hypothetical protein